VDNVIRRWMRRSRIWKNLGFPEVLHREKGHGFFPGQLERIQPPCIAGSRAEKVSSRGEETPGGPRPFADPSVKWKAI
jgi:hypothetical protein